MVCVHLVCVHGIMIVYTMRIGLVTHYTVCVRMICVVRMCAVGSDMRLNVYVVICVSLCGGMSKCPYVCIRVSM